MILLQEVVTSVGRRRVRYVLNDTAEATDAPSAANRTESVYAAIRQDRRSRPLDLPLASFADVFAEGNLIAQNAAIAAISRHYRSEMLPALVTALGSETNAVRVQAAAVFAKYRSMYGARATELIAAGLAVADAEEGVARAAACCEVAACGFLDRATAETLRTLAARLDACAVSIRGVSARPERIDCFIAETLRKPALGAVSPLGPYGAGE